MVDHYTIPLREVCDRLHAERRSDETRAMLATASATPPNPLAKETSEDGKCLRCRASLYVLQRQEHLNRDWCACSFCGTTMPATIGVAGEPIRHG